LSPTTDLSLNERHRLHQATGLVAADDNAAENDPDACGAPASCPICRLRRPRQFSSYDWRDFLAEHNLQQSMSRRGNCHDNAVAESFFQLLKRERIRRKTYGTRDEARQDVFDYIKMFYNPKRRHSFSNDMSPVEYEKQYFRRLSSV
jgi:hypothetical protein